MTRLADLEPPPDRSPGYYPDPLGGKHPRWWDGDGWVAQVGPEDGKRAEEPRSFWWAVEHYAGLTATTVAFLVVHGNLFTRAAIALAAGLIVDGLFRLYVWLNPDRRPAAEQSGPPTAD